MKIVNPTDKRIEIQYKGDVYSVEPNDFKDGVSTEVATFWKGIHEFIFVEDTDVKELPKIKEEIEVEEVKEVKEEKKTTKKVAKK